MGVTQERGQPALEGQKILHFEPFTQELRTRRAAMRLDRARTTQEPDRQEEHRA